MARPWRTQMAVVMEAMLVRRTISRVLRPIDFSLIPYTVVWLCKLWVSSERKAHVCTLMAERRTHSPKMTINAVEMTTACQPPPNTESRIMGSVSLTITLDSKRVTSTQCLPRSRSLRTIWAFAFSASVPDSISTWRLVSSRPFSKRMMVNMLVQKG